MDTQFKIYGELILEKSLANAPEGQAQADEYVIKGRVLNAVKDLSGETPIVAETDWSYFDKHGYVKYEHDPIETVIGADGKLKMQKSQPEPENIIGVPLRRTTKGTSEVFLEAALLPRMDKAQSVVKLMKALREHNEKYPDAKRTLGYSIEGGYARKSADGHYVARVINVAITPIPVDCTSYVEQTTKANRAMQKSLAAGYATSPEGQADGGALRKQSIEGAKNNISQGGSEMEKFGSKDECYKHHVTKGLAAEEAKKKAEEWEAAQAQKATVENAAAEKSLAAVVDQFQTSIDSATELVKNLDAKAEGMTQLDVQIKKSLTALSANEAVDGAELFANQGKATMEVASMTRDGFTALAKSISAQAEGMRAQNEIVKSLVASVSAIAEQVKGVIEGQAKLTNGIKKSVAATTPDAAHLPVVGVEAEELRKVVTPLAAEDFLVDRAIAEREKNPQASAMYFEAQKSLRLDGFASLSKSLRDEITAKFGKK